MNHQEIIDTLAGLALFADLDRPQLEAVAHTLSDESFAGGQRILRQGYAGSGFYIALEGELVVRVDGEDIARLGKGDFFGETSLLLGEPPIADVVAVGPVSALQLSGSDLREFLLAYPVVMYRMLQALSRRLDVANRHG